ncbi:MAG: biopolymer transporter ExbD [Candidatus Cloacimonetes bacterium]|nr:biopolymer transporter ExbD [Candidatus Cloacimonadota bacterium]
MALRPSRRLSTFGDSQPPNLIPMMNLFLVLIPMLITMIVTVKLAVMEINLPSKGISKEKNEIEKENNVLENLIIVITEKKDILLLGYDKGITDENKFLMGKDKDAKIGIKIPHKKDEYDLYTLENYIKEIKESYKEQSRINFACDESVQYEDLIKTMDLCRRNGLPEIGIVKFVTMDVGI